MLTSDRDRAVFLFGGTTIHERGTYRLWYECYPERYIGAPQMGNLNDLRYAESDDGESWRLPSVGRDGGNAVYGADPCETGYHGGSVFIDPSAPHDLWYTQSTNRMPGAPDYWVMFPMRWSLTTDTFTFHLATSPDGVLWDLVPAGPNGEDGPVCEPGAPGAWDQGVVSPGLGLVDLPGDRIGVLYAGSPVPHKHARKPPLGALAWAWWPTGRLVALEAAAEGSLALWPLHVNGRTARVNVVAPSARAHAQEHGRRAQPSRMTPPAGPRAARSQDEAVQRAASSASSPPPRITPAVGTHPCTGRSAGLVDAESR